ncbi:hypothetical protein CQW23_27901 [Capsicum baccatum]|uniref:Uncharacterized protein n=1 Tax=Capsicum baccatum TaxID=33114 RepID=A0A2G2VF05_CAPBA|nr:hypothetical protein CQW23_27901 [Capsicum baccatum]
MLPFNLHLLRRTETESGVMDQRLSVDAITKETIGGCSCKVQVVDKFRPRESRDQSVQFQTMIVQDESKQQVAIVLYGDDIPKYERLSFQDIFGFLRKS